MNSHSALWTLLGLAFAAGIACPDDADVSFGGAPRMLLKSTSVSMVRELVRVHVGRLIHYDCTFWFRNSGPPCRVRMGFPDWGWGASQTSYGENEEQAKSLGKPIPAPHYLEHFRSEIAGRRTHLSYSWNRDTLEGWHVKTVRFRANQMLEVRDTFDIDASGDNSWAVPLRVCKYVLSTGSSWKGPIRDVEIDVQLAPGEGPARLHVVPITDFKKDNTDDLGRDTVDQYTNWKTLRRGTVVWSGFGRPQVKGHLFKFVAHNLEPTTKSDIELIYLYRGE